MKRAILKLAANERGGTAIEYGFILALVVIALLAALMSFAETSNDIWSNVSDKVVGAH
jgi:pilus assembly protein Flp/PilA